MDYIKTRIRIAPFILGIICFFLPFMEISCRGEQLASFTGVQLLTGADLTEDSAHQEKQSIPPNIYAIASLIALIIGLIASFSMEKRKSIIAGVMSISALISILLMKTRMDSRILKEASGLPLTIDYKVGFWGLCIACIAGAIIAFLRVQNHTTKQDTVVKDSNPIEQEHTQH
jgi:C4-dicarboxylate transporter